MKKSNVAYPGIAGSYSNEAARQYFQNSADLIPKEDFEQIFLSVLSGECKYGIVPVENTITGSVIQNYDLLGTHHCYITGETILPIFHVLLGRQDAQLADIQQVYSHEQGFLQCAKFLAAHKEWLCIPYTNTAVAAKYVADGQDKTKAAIASEYAGKRYGLKILAEDLSEKSQNSTRFFIIGAKREWNNASGKASILFSLKHERGSLARALSHLSGLNLTRIESRPSPKTNWEYLFYVDLEGDLSDLENTVEGLGAYCTNVRLLGIYAAAKE